MKPSDTSNRKSLIQFFKFSLVGISNTIVGLGVYYILLWLGMHYMLANFIGWAVGVANAFFWNNKYVFKNENTWWKALSRTYVSYGVSFLVGAILLYVLVDFLGVGKYLAPILALVITTPLNFFMNKFWTFR